MAQQNPITGSFGAVAAADAAGVHVPGLGVVQTIERSHTPLGPHGEYCRVCRRAAQAGQAVRRLDASKRVRMPRSNVLRRAGDLDVIAVPYVLKYLVAELAAMGLRMSFAIAP